MNDRRIGVYIVEGIPLVALGLETLIGNSPETVLVGSSSPAGFDPSGVRERPDVLMVDAVEVDPAGITAAVRERWEGSTAVLALTPAELPGFDLRPWLRSGASGGVCKASPLSHILQAVRAVARGETYNHTRVVRDRRDRRRRAPLGSLTEREKKVLSMIAQGMTSREAAEAMNLSNRTIETHVRTIFLKLNVNNRAHAVSRAIEEGIIRPPGAAGNGSV
jgi:DNA-binding NarL/FixJ family response regulator